MKYCIHLLLAFSLIGLGCVVDDDNNTGGSAGDGGTAGNGGSAGDGGTAGDGGSAPDNCPPDACPNNETAFIDARLCADEMTLARSRCTRDADGVCGWIEECPEDVPCTDEECGEAPLLPTMVCPDGENTAGRGPCVRNADWVCGYIITQCPDEDACTPGESFDADDGCNTCTCPESGLKSEAVCTEIGCPPNPERCEPGESFDADDGCNTCTCPESGLKSEAVCTVIGCPPDPQRCEPGESFEADDGCNTCMCPESGLKSEAACTRIGCPPDPERCEPGEQIPAGDGCNSCECPESGIRSDAISCTEADCSGPCDNDADCLDTQYCAFPDESCGVFAQGQCTGRPDICEAGGVGACGCDGTPRLNECELQGGGTDAFKFGGCDFNNRDSFACGEMSCNPETDLCRIAMNDVVGENQPEYFSRCEALPNDCRQGDCSCFEMDPAPGVPLCFDGTGFTFLFDLGG